MTQAAWEWSPAIVVPLAAAACAYGYGLARLWSVGIGRGVRVWQAASFALGILALVAALLSPIHEASETLFSIHMIQHELLMVVAAPLIVLGRPLVPFVYALPPRARPHVTRVTRVSVVQSGWVLLTRASVAWLVQALVILIWHVPKFYDAAVANDALHAFQHACFLGAALLFWWTMVHGAESHPRRKAAMIYLFATATYSTLLGALLVTADHPWYAAYATLRPDGDLTPSADQQLAGLIMWIPACLSYLAAALILALGWLRDTGRGRHEGWVERALHETERASAAPPV